MRMAQQICGDLADNGVLNVLRLGNRWDLAFHQSLKRDAKGEVVEFDIDPRLVEQFAAGASTAVRKTMAQGESFVLVTAPDARPYVRMIIERMFPTLPVLSHVEIARGVEVKSLGPSRDDEHIRLGHGHVPDLLPGRHLHDGRPRLFALEYSGAGQAVPRDQRHIDADAACWKPPFARWWMERQRWRSSGPSDPSWWSASSSA